MTHTEQRGSARIRTPDQRLRVFVSSTLGELAAERKAARRAIERLSAAPVMFELGARPHPPRSLYRAYLEQSDIFVGIYWEKYGWVAPGETVSGLEDEYNLASADMPKLMYFKAPNGSRDPALDKLLDRIREDDTAAYKHFRDAKELGRLLVADLAVLLAERFDDSRGPSERPSEPVPAAEEAKPDPRGRAQGLPAPLTRLFGRSDDIAQAAEILRSPEIRLLTLLGPGGIGKTRLAIEAARRLTSDFPEVVFVPLASIDNADQVPRAIAQALGVLDTGEAPLEEKLEMSLATRSMLLVLDNFEQVADAAPLVSDLLSHAPGLKVLTTSRVLLKVAGEQAYEVSALSLPTDRSRPWSPGDALAPSAELFLERARSMKPDLELSPDNVRAIELIVTKLEGVPLAIELAAARSRLLTPPALLEKLDRQLPLLTGGQRDAPARQKAVRSTIEWSARLLSDDERDLLWRLGVFSGRFSLDAVEAVAPPGADVLTILEALVDSSIVRQQDRDGRTYFQLLATVREYGLEQLEALGLTQEMRSRHAGYYLSWGGRLVRALLGPGQQKTRVLLTDQLDNLRTAVRFLLDSGEWDHVADFASSAFLYWWMLSRLGEVRGWMSELLAAGEEVPGRARATAYFLTALSMAMQEEWNSVPDVAGASAVLFEREGESTMATVARTFSALSQAGMSPAHLAEARRAAEVALPVVRDGGAVWWEEMLLLFLGRLDLFEHKPAAAMRHLRAMVDLAANAHDDFGMTFALFHVGWAHLMSGDLREAAALMSSQMEMSLQMAHEQALTFTFEGFVALAGTVGDVERAGLMAGAAEGLHVRTGTYEPPAGAYHRPVIEEILAGPDADVFQRGLEEGRRMPLQQAVAVAREVAAEVDRREPAEGRPS